MDGKGLGGVSLAEPKKVSGLALESVETKVTKWHQTFTGISSKILLRCVFHANFLSLYHHFRRHLSDTYQSEFAQQTSY